jgi:hypothetical protein
LVLIAFGDTIQNLTQSLIQRLYSADPTSLGGRIFSLAARNASGIPVEGYIQKALSFLEKWQRGLTLLSSLAVIFSGLAFICLKLAQIGLDKDFLTLPRLHSLPALSMPKKYWPRTFQVILVPGILLGLTAAIRILGLFGWILVGIYFFLKTERHYLAGLIGSGTIAFITMVLFWPYLGPAPLTRLIAVLKYMSSNPISVPVLFNGTVYSSLSLPRLYFPTLLGLNLTEPVWPLFLFSLFCAVFLAHRRQLDWRSLVPILLWFFLPLLYILLLRPPMYDGIRHFLLILPPVFILCSLAIEMLFHWLQQPWLRAGLVVLILAPGIFNTIQLHPYQYTYFNTLAGGLKGANRKYDLDYWLTCYKEAMEQVEQSPYSNARIFVLRVPEIATYYVSDPSQVVEYVSDADQMTAGDLLLLSTRENLDQVIHPEYPTVISIGRQNATFCVVKEAP